MTTTDNLITLTYLDAITRDDMAVAYNRALFEHSQGADVDWGKINHAIIKRWSLSALKYIKRKAWKPS